MALADYELCPGCGRKALYMGDDEAPDGVEVWHTGCRREEAEAILATDRQQRAVLIRSDADRVDGTVSPDRAYSRAFATGMRHAAELVLNDPQPAVATDSPWADASVQVFDPDVRNA